jgi:hypothetical protein
MAKIMERREYIQFNPVSLQYNTGGEKVQFKIYYLIFLIFLDFNLI